MPDGGQSCTLVIKEECMTNKATTTPGLATRPSTFAALVAGATTLGLLAMGWITIRKLRPF